jgi:hypothetical protein
VFSDSEGNPPQAENPEDTESSEGGDTELVSDGGTPSEGASAEASEASSEDGPEAGNPGKSPDGPSSDAMEAARIALEEAGMASGTAADAGSSASSDEELAAAEDALANARVSIIIAGQDLAQARQVLTESDAQGTATEASGAAGESSIDAAEEALASATLAIVVATGAIMDASAGFPDDAQRLPSGGVLTNMPGTGQGSELDAELEASLIIFDGRIEESRQAVLSPGAPSTRTGLPPRQPREQGATSGDAQEDTNMATGAGVADAADEKRPQTDAQSSGMGRGASQAAKAAGATNTIPDDINDGQNDDIVAQQLREAALAETDEALREKLWEEYRRYKSGQ